MDATVQQLVERFGMTPLPVEATDFVSTDRSVQYVIPAGVWQAGELVAGGGDACIRGRNCHTRCGLSR